MIVIGSFVVYNRSHSVNRTTKAGYSKSECRKAVAWVDGVFTLEPDIPWVLPTSVPAAEVQATSVASLGNLQTAQATQTVIAVPTMAALMADANNTFFTDAIQLFKDQTQGITSSVTLSKINYDKMAWANALSSFRSDCN